jgi:hypothetical protein
MCYAPLAGGGFSMNNYLLWWPIAGLIVFVLFIAFILIVKP